MADALPMAEVVHAIPGRARLRIAERRGDAVFFASVATGLSTIAGVYNVQVRPLTGSLLIQHGPSLERVGEAAKKAGLFVIAKTAPAAPPQSVKWPALLVDPRMTAAVGLGLMALWQVRKGNVLPPALTVAWYAAHMSGLLSVGDGAGEAE